MGLVKHAFVLAFHLLMRAEKMPIEKAFDFAMEQCAILAGDTDTNCAIVGGLVGAYVGVGNIDKTKLQKVLECDHEQGGINDRPDLVKPMVSGFDSIRKLIQTIPLKLSDEGIEESATTQKQGKSQLKKKKRK